MEKRGVTFFVHYIKYKCYPLFFHLKTIMYVSIKYKRLVICVDWVSLVAFHG